LQIDAKHVKIITWSQLD